MKTCCGYTLPVSSIGVSDEYPQYVFMEDKVFIWQPFLSMVKTFFEYFLLIFILILIIYFSVFMPPPAFGRSGAYSVLP